MTGQLHQDPLSDYLKRECSKIVWRTEEELYDQLLPLLDSIAAKAFEMAAKHEPVIIGSGAKVACRGCDWKPTYEAVNFAEHIAQLSPASARLQLQLDLLKARLEAVNYVIAHAPGRLPQLVQDYIARLESEIAALEAQQGRETT